jgi:predicted nucleotidyltransferase
MELKDRLEEVKGLLSEVNLYQKDNENNYCAYLFGSRTYNTHTEDSDYDFIIILNEEKSHPEELKTEYVNLKIYTPKEFQIELDNHDISALEVYFLYEKQLAKKGFSITINKQKLRKSISSIVSNSWVKAKKKITVENEIYIGIKSLFHSIRITEYGRQIAEKGLIYDYYRTNNIWNEILKDKEKSWEELAEKYKPLYNSKLTEFRKLAPKKAE